MIMPNKLGVLLFSAALGAGAETVLSPDPWPRWRGPFDNGVARGDAPTEWSDTKNVAWKVAIPGRGFSTPVIWGDRLFLTTAVPTESAPAGQPGEGGGRGAGGGAAAGVEHKFIVMALDRRTGKTVWEAVATVARPHEGYHRKYGSFASNSPVTDGKHLWAFFGSRGIYCYTLDGRLVWKKSFRPLKMRNQFGEGTAAVLAEDRLILNFDDETDSFLVALDKTTGEELWRMARDEPSSWAPPKLVEHDGVKQIVVSATRKVRSYDPQTGKLLWECGGLGTNVIPAPVDADGRLFVMSGHREPNLLAIKLGGKGDLTGTDAVLWTNQRGNAYTASPVLDGGKLYFVTDNGMLTCLDAATGKPYYAQVRLPKPYNFKASPVAANGKLYLATEQGDVVVVKMGEKFEVLATNTLTDQFFVASPVVADGDLYLRSHENVYCIRQQ